VRTKDVMAGTIAGKRMTLPRRHRPRAS
jgi:hypothetical protein